MQITKSAAAPMIAALLLLITVGCASPWEKNFQANPMLDHKPPPTQDVQLRTVEVERLRNYEDAERKERIESTTSPADFTPEQRLAAKNRLLEALQLRERGDDIQIVGWSRFIDSEPRDPNDPELREFARTIGADVVVTSIGYVGQVSRIVDYPLTSYSNYYTSVHGARRGRGTLYSGSAYSTVWVPTPVTENQYYHQAVFLHRIPKSATTQAASGSSLR